MSNKHTAAQVVRYALEDRLPGSAFTERDKLRIGRFEFDLDKLSQQIVDDLVEADYIGAVENPATLAPSGSTPQPQPWKTAGRE